MPAPRLTTAQAIGSYGERVAAAHVRRLGYRVLIRNYLTTRGELDLICRHGEMLVFVEVRTRGGEEFGRPAESIGAEKEDALRYAARRYLEQLKREDILYRFDAVEVTLHLGERPVCHLIENLFS